MVFCFAMAFKVWFNGQMNKGSISKTALIIIVAVILAAIGVYCYKSQVIKKSPVAEVTPIPNESSSADFPQEIIMNDQPSADTETPNTASGQVAGTSTTASAGDAIAVSNFDAAMKNARNAFLARDYKNAIKQYNQALRFKNDDTAYAGLFLVYGAQNDWKNARISIDKAIALAPANTDYYKWKIGMLDEKTDADYEALKAVYLDAIPKLNIKTKINLMTYFAGIAESNGQKQDAISFWQSAIETYPQNKAIYQAEIDRLKASL